MPETHFQRARKKAIMGRLLRAVLSRDNALLSLSAVKSGRVYAGQTLSGIQQIPLTCIVGSINRTRDFDRDFNPLTDVTRQRWERIEEAFLNGEALPPVELQKVGDEYFVRDGHHRVSVARTHGALFIDAAVTDSLCLFEHALEVAA